MISPLSAGGRGPVSGVRAVAEHLRREIALGRLAEGDKLPAERQLAEQLGVSRETLRQALRELEGAGELSIQRGASGGAFITQTPVSPGEAARALRGRRGEILELAQFRDVVESAAARLAAENADAALIGRLDAAIDEMEASEGLATARVADTRFHLAIAEGSGNALLVSAIEDARVRMFGPVDVFEEEFVKPSSLAAHRRVRDAIAARDGAAAAAAMREHLATTTAEFDRLIAPAEEGDPR